MSASVETISGSVAAAGGRRLDRPADVGNGTAAHEAAVPARAGGVELLGEVAGSGYRRPPALARRADGQTIQLTPLLYHLLKAIDGKRDSSELAAVVSERTGRLATAEDVHFLTEAKLRPLGLLRQPDGSEPSVQKANPLLALGLKLVVSNPTVTNRLTAPFAALFYPPLVLAVAIAFALTTWWVAFEKGLGSAAYQAFHEPALLLLAFGLTVLSAGFHEIGHAAACRYGGARPGAMGVGLYLVWPAFYTDVTDSYRLGRGGRLRVDLGGLYFNAIFGLAILGVWRALRWDALLLVVAAQLLQMVRQLVPIVRFDGYHILADLIGVPDLFLHIKPTLLGLLPTRWRRAEGKTLKPWARAIVTLWVFLVVPLLAGLLVLLVIVLPRIVATAWESLGEQWSAFQVNWAAADVEALAVGLLAMLTISLPVAGIAYLLARVVRRTVRRAWRATAGRPTLRAGAVLAGAAVLAGVAWAWWPDGQYRPLEPDTVSAPRDAPRLTSSVAPSLVPLTAPAAAPAREPVTTERQGRWMLVLLPQQAVSGQVADGRAVAPTEPDGWPFPYDPPKAPREGDNQALAVNTKDGSSVFEVAVALVWVTDGGPVDNRNEAWALASCNGCRTTAVSFQAVLVIGHAQVVTPVNTAVALNYDCRNCVTQALAVQLVATLAQPPSADTRRELEELWARLEERSRIFELLPLDQVYGELLTARAAILEIVGRDGAVATETGVAAEVATTAPAPPPEEPTTTTSATEPAAPSEDTSTTTTTPTETTAPEEEPGTTTEEAPTTTEEAPPPTTTTTP